MAEATELATSGQLVISANCHAELIKAGMMCDGFGPAKGTYLALSILKRMVLGAV